MSFNIKIFVIVIQIKMCDQRNHFSTQMKYNFNQQKSSSETYNNYNLKLPVLMYFFTLQYAN